MKKYLLLLLVPWLSLSVCAEFFDPMQPPPLALKKFKLEKIKSQNKNKGTVSVQKNEKKPAPWVLSSILYSSQRKHAIINNKLVKQGEVIAGARLIRLKPDSVRLLAKGKVIDLSLRKSLKSIKKSSNGRKL